MPEPSDLIVPGRQPRKRGGVRQILDVPAGQAPKIKLRPGALIVIDDIGLRFHEEGPFIILPLERWTRTLGLAVIREQEIIENRQARRAAARDRRN